MEIKKITKTDKNGKRLFVEIGKNLKRDNDLLRPLKKGDEVAILTMRKLNDKEITKLVGKYIRFLDINEDESFSLCFEGVLKINKAEFWDDEDNPDAKKRKYALEDPENGIIDSFDNLNHVFDLQVIEGEERFVNKVNCSKCKKQIFEGYRYCPFCGRNNILYKQK